MTVYEVNHATDTDLGQIGVAVQFLRQIDLSNDADGRDGMRTIAFSSEDRSQVIAVNDVYSAPVSNRGQQVFILTPMMPPGSWG